MKLTEQFTTSIYGFRSYGLLSKMNGGKSFLYIFLLFLLMYLVFSINFTMTANEVIKFVENDLNDLIGEMPDFYISDGILTVDAPMPYIHQGEGLTIVIDTTKTSAELMQDHDIVNGFVITKDEFVAVSPANVQPIQFSLFENQFDKNELLEFITKIKGFIRVFLWIVLAFWIIFAFAGKLLGVLVLTLITLIASVVFNQRLKFQENWNVAIYASTVPVLFSCIHSLLGAPLGALGFFVYWGLATAYVFTGMYYIARENEQNQNPEIIEAPLV